jgi:hypothetical protein
MSIGMTAADRRCLAALFDLADEAMSAADCNDFPLAQLMPVLAERRALMRDAMWRNGTPSDYDPAATYEVVMDFQVLDHLRHVLGLTGESP